MKKIPVLILCFSASQLLAYSLDDILNLSKEHDPGYQSKVLQLSADEKSGLIAMGQSLPSITLSLTGAKSSADGTASTSSSKLKLNTSIPLYNPKSIHAVSLGKLGTQMARLEQRSFQTSHILSITDSYFTALSAHASYETKLTALRHYQKSYEESVEMEKAGLKTHVNTLVNLSAYDTGRVAAVTAKNTLQHALSSLEGKIDGPITALNAYHQEYVPKLTVAPLEELVKHALSSGTKVQKSRLELQKAREALASAEATFFPTVTLNVGASQTLGQLQYGVLDREHSNIETSVAISLNVFNGFSDYYKVQQQALSYQAASETQKNELYNIRLSIEKSYQDFLNAALKGSASLTAMQSAKASLDALSEQHRAGSATELELLAAITQNSSAQQSYYESIYQYFQSYLSLKSSASALSNDDITQISHLLHLETVLRLTNDPS